MAGFFSPATLEQIRAANDIVEIIGTYVPLKRSGANFMGLCPFHREKTPSFSVNPQRQIFYCFGCHKGGDVFTFLKEYENITFPDAVRRLAERARIPLEIETEPGAGPPRHIKDRLLLLHEQITGYWQNILAREAVGRAARDYLQRRGVSPEAVRLFRLGAAPDAWDDTVNWARKRGYDLALVEQAGLILRKEGGDRFYDRFRGRLIFPICDEQGRVIGFSGRVLDPEGKVAKYVNSPETPIFTKSRVFYGLDKSKRALLDAGVAVVCEGQLDLIACFMAGIKNVVAPQGTAFTADHARLLKRYVEEVVLCFDSDDAGQEAAVRSLNHLLASGLAIRVAVVPAPHDPDSFIRAAGGAAFQQLITNAEDFFDFYLKRLCRLHDPATPRGRLVILRAMAEAVHKTGSAVVVDTAAQKTALQLAVAPESVHSEFRKLARSPRAPAPAEAHGPAAPERPPHPPTPEMWLLKILFAHDAAAAWLAEHLELEWLNHEGVRAVVQARLAAHREGRWSGMPAFLDQFEDPATLALISEAGVEERPILRPRQQLADITARLRNQFLDREITACRHRAAKPETPEAERIELLRRLQELRARKATPLPPPEGLPE